MTKLVLTFCLLLAYGNSIAQMPYAYELEKPRKSVGVYLLEDNPQFTHYLRFFDFEFESVVYFHNSDTLCELTSYSYHNSKQFLRKDFLLDVKRVYRQDSLKFAVEVNDELYSLVPMEDQVFHIRKVFELLKLPQNKGVFYKNKLAAFLRISPVLVPVQVAQIIEPWYVDPKTNQSFVSPACLENNNLPCMCAALQFGANNDYTKAQQIASYLIKRFEYGYGDTSQYHPVGLLTSEQNLAVCAGYSQMYDWLLKESAIKSKYVSGAVRADQNDIFYSGHSEIEGKRYHSDVTWAKDTTSNWLMNNEANFFLTHFANPTNDTLWDLPQQRTMYEFMHQPMIRNPEKTAAANLKNLRNPMPFQFAQKEFTVSFSKPVNVSAIHFYDLTYPFVRFEGEKAIADQLRLSLGNSIPYKKTTTDVRFELKEQFTRVALYVDGIGTIDYCIYNGTEKEFYQFMLEQIDARSPYSVALAFLACAKLNDVKEFNKLKPYLENPKMSFKTFQKQANTQHIEDFDFAVFNATRHYGDFSGYSFEYSNAPTEPRIYLRISDNSKYYSFTGFATDTWELRKK
jgi:hypothetical protein